MAMSKVGYARGVKIYDILIKPKLHEVSELVAKGYNKKDLAKHFNISYITFLKYVNENPELQKAIDDGNNDIIDEVENSLIMAAKGGVLKTLRKRTFVDAEGKISHEEEEVIKEVGCNVDAAKYVLQNKRPRQWRNMKSVNIDGAVNIRVELPPPADPNVIDAEVINEGTADDFDKVLTDE